MRLDIDTNLDADIDDEIEGPVIRPPPPPGEVRNNPDQVK